jgi:hypothetical protein
MTIKIIQRVYRYGSRTGWIGELGGALFVTVFLLSFGVAILVHGIFGDPKYRPGKEQPIPPRTLHLLIGGLLTPFGMYFGYVAIRTFRERHEMDEHKFVLTGVTSYEVVSESDDESFQSDETKKTPWYTTY